MVDILAALRGAQRKRGRVLGVVNGVGSSMARECDDGVHAAEGVSVG